MSIKIYKEHHAFNPPLLNQYQTKIWVEDVDTLGVASFYNDSCCLNFAYHKRPDGGYKAVQHVPMPIKTQEEDLFRRSNLPEFMDNKHIKKHYPLQGLKSIYCKNIIVDKNQTLIPHEPFFTSIITAPAVINPTHDDQILVENKIKRILDIAADNHHETLILGAWGCGVFNNDPENIANLFCNFIKNDFQGVFRNVIFAIPNKESKNYQLFENVIQRWSNLILFIINGTPL